MGNKLSIKWFDVLDSTNDQLLRHIQDYDNLSVAAALQQTSGRGQRGNRWISAPGESLLFSILLKPEDFPASAAFSISEAAAVSVRDALRDCGCRAVVKWPNDLYVGDSKICGILVENGVADGRILHSVVGIGINLSQKNFPPELMNPTSLYLQGCEVPSPESMLERVGEQFLRRWQQAQSASLRADLHRDYGDGLYRLGELHEWSLPDGTLLRGTLTGVLPDARLQLRDAAGTDHLFRFKEVGYLI